MAKCPILYWNDLSESEQSDFDGMEDESFFRLGEFVFALSEFVRHGDFGIYSFNAFHGVKITIEDDGDAVNAEFIAY
jgi:hypothetical protein